MFENTLLEFSPLRSSVLKSVHRLAALGASGLGFLLTLHLLPLLAPASTTRTLVPVAALAGAASGFYALAVLYVAADARQLQLRAWWLWTGATLAFSLAGFLSYLVYSAVKSGDWKRISIPLAYTVEIGLVGLLLMMPLIYTQALPELVLTKVFPPPGSPSGPAPGQPRAHPKARSRITMRDLMSAPTQVPRSIARVADQPEPTPDDGLLLTGDVPNGVSNGLPPGIVDSIGPSTPPPPPVTIKPRNPVRIRVGGHVEAARLIYGPAPEYPTLARMARIQGTVHLEAVIGKDGSIQGLKLLSGHPLLVKAAVDAVQRWRYQPTLLNGEPVEVITDIDVNFTLGD